MLDTIKGHLIDFTSKPCQDVVPHTPHYTADQDHLIKEELKELLSKGAVVEVTNPRRGFYSNLFLIPKKDGGQRPVINLKVPEQFRSDTTLQDGGNPYFEGSDTTRRLVGNSGSEGRLLCSHDPPFSPSIPQIQLPGEVLSVHLPPIWPVIGSLGLYQDPKASISSPSGDGSVPNSMHRRYPSPGGVPGTSKESCGGHSLPPTMSWVSDKLKEISAGTSTIYGIPGPDSGHCGHGIKLPVEKIKTIRTEARSMAMAGHTSARAIARLVGKMNATSRVIPPAPLLYRHLQMALSEALNSNCQCYETQVSLSRYIREELKWWDNHMVKWNGKSLLSKEIDMIIDSDASLMGWGAVCQNQRTGGPWSQSESQMQAVQTFLKHKTRLSALLRLDNTSAVAYINNLGETVSPELVDLAKSLWMWCLERNIHITAQHLPGHIADAESQTMVDWSDWKLNLILFKRIVNLFGPIEVDLFASRLTAPCPVYFSWWPDPYAAATDAFLQDWSQIRGYANPPWSLIGQVTGSGATGLYHSGGTSLEDTTLVPTTSRYAEGIPLSDQTPSDNAQSRLGESVPTASRMAYLRERYREHELSEEATSLLLKSWRTKTNRSYDSLFRKWHSWCHSRGSDPCSGPVKEVVNFLANLHDEGYTYCSLNSYQSAISSVHERVDGCPVGQHPLVIRLMKGVFNDRPPLPRYTSTWNVQMVLNHFGSLGSND